MAFGEKRISFDKYFLATPESFDLIKQKIQSCGMSSFLGDLQLMSDPVVGRNMIKSVVCANGCVPLKLEIILESDMPL